jgi:predicted O-methyltransferase YrrM
MGDVVPVALDAYAEAFSSAEPALLRKITRETHVQLTQSHMLSGNVQGRFLAMISRLVAPRRILEIGTFTGYSAICLAEGLVKGGTLDTIDHDDELTDRAAGYFREAGLSETIIQHTGEALDILPRLEGPYELVFLDADKVNYEKYFDLVIDRVPSGGVILVDNVMFHGEVFLPGERQGLNGRAISAFNKRIAGDDRLEKVMLTLRDGLFFIQKK